MLIMRQVLVVFALIPATLASAFGFLQWVFGFDREGDEDGIKHFFGLLAPEMRPVWMEAIRDPTSKRKVKNVITEWTRYHVEGPGDAEVPGKVLSFMAWCLFLVGLGLGWLA